MIVLADASVRFTMDGLHRFPIRPLDETEHDASVAVVEVRVVVDVVLRLDREVERVGFDHVVGRQPRHRHGDP